MINLNKPLQTKKGLPVTILKSDMRGDNLPLLGFYTAAGRDFPCRWAVDGKYAMNGGDCGLDLENVPEAPTVVARKVITRYCAVYRTPAAVNNDGFLAPEYSDENGAKDRAAGCGGFVHEHRIAIEILSDGSIREAAQSLRVSELLDYLSIKCGYIMNTFGVNSGDVRLTKNDIELIMAAVKAYRG